MPARTRPLPRLAPRLRRAAVALIVAAILTGLRGAPAPRNAPTATAPTATSAPLTAGLGR
ncbi:MAG: hypothetical protein KBG48_29445 [Kofleriaceae bacterium]|nr:hypothetical protein [Kofleriaceae bacterium]MBP9171552.1 hypothetical protein [Kofleriaceae bacterium]MBP9860199.1 hypothetical protein [Kofleriaceae bacterium]